MSLSIDDLTSIIKIQKKHITILQKNIKSMNSYHFNIVEHYDKIGKIKTNKRFSCLIIQRNWKRYYTMKYLQNILNPKIHDNPSDDEEYVSDEGDTDYIDVNNEILLLKEERRIKNNLEYIFQPSKIDFTIEYLDILKKLFKHFEYTDKQCEFINSTYRCLFNHKQSEYLRVNCRGAFTTHDPFPNFKIHVVNKIMTDIKHKNFEIIKVLNIIVNDI